MAITKRQRLEEQDQPGINRNCISNNDNAVVTGGIGGVVEKEWRITHRVKGRRNIPTDSTMIVAAKYRIITRAPSRPPPVVASTSSTHKSAQQQEQQRQPEYSTAPRATTRTESSGDDGFVVEPGLEDIPIFRAGSGAEANALRASPGYQSFYKACQQVWLDSNKGCKVGKRTVLELVQAKMGTHRRFVKQIAIPTTTTTTTTTTSSKTKQKQKKPHHSYAWQLIEDTAQLAQICLSRISNMRQQSEEKEAVGTSTLKSLDDSDEDAKENNTKNKNNNRKNTKNNNKTVMGTTTMNRPKSQPTTTTIKKPKTEMGIQNKDKGHCPTHNHKDKANDPSSFLEDDDIGEDTDMSIATNDSEYLESDVVRNGGKAWTAAQAPAQVPFRTVASRQTVPTEPTTAVATNNNDKKENQRTMDKPSDIGGGVYRDCDGFSSSTTATISSGIGRGKQILPHYNIKHCDNVHHNNQENDNQNLQRQDYQLKILHRVTSRCCNHQKSKKAMTATTAYEIHSTGIISLPSFCDLAWCRGLIEDQVPFLTEGRHTRLETTTSTKNKKRTESFPTDQHACRWKFGVRAQLGNDDNAHTMSSHPSSWNVIETDTELNWTLPDYLDLTQQRSGSNNKNNSKNNTEGGICVLLTNPLPF